jgi:AraC-like DNA-binding protein
MLLKATRYTAPTRQVGAMHRHDFHELVIITAGSGTHVCGTQRYPVYSGDCFIVLPGEPHGFISREGLEVVNVIFYADLLSPHFDFFREIPGFLHFFSVEPLFREEESFRHKLHLNVSQQKKALQMVEGITRERRECRPGFRVAALSCFYDLVILISRLYGEAGRQGERAQELAGKEQVVARAVALMQERSTEEISVPEIAQGVYLSTSRLQHVFKETMGVSLSECLLNIRMEHACSLLQETDASVQHIAGQVGFHDRGYFSRMFRRRTGRSPAQYRKSHRTADRPETGRQGRE